MATYERRSAGTGIWPVILLVLGFLVLRTSLVRLQEEPSVQLATVDFGAPTPEHWGKHSSEKFSSSDVLKELKVRAGNGDAVSYCDDSLRAILLPDMDGFTGIVIVLRATGEVVTAYASSNSFQYEAQKQIERGFVRCY